MGGRGSSSGGGGGGGFSARFVTSQGGQTVDLSNNPLQYGGADGSLTPAQRAKIEAFEKAKLANKVEYSYMVDANGNEIGMVKGGKGSVRTPITMLSQAEVFSHNHPRGKGDEGVLGGSFSNQDMNVFTKYPNMKTMRASAAEGTYSITKGSNFDASGFRSYARSIDKAAKQTLSNKVQALSTDLANKKISYNDYFKGYDDAFNSMLVEMHNGYINGAKQYGYNYTLERRP